MKDALEVSIFVNRPRLIRDSDAHRDILRKVAALEKVKTAYEKLVSDNSQHDLDLALLRQNCFTV